MTGKPLILGTRGSALALAQTGLVLDALREAWPQRTFTFREIKTTGDRRQDLSLTHLAPGGHGYESAGGLRQPERVDPGLFTRELESELLAGGIDVAVHSLKDLPTVMPASLKLSAVLPRADPADVLIWKDQPNAPVASQRIDAPLSMLAPGAVVATSSLRRQRQLLHLRADLGVSEVRGNVGTRLAKLRDRPEWSALVLARAGLERLGIVMPPSSGRIETEDGGFSAAVLATGMMLPAVGQGAIGLQTRDDDADTLAALASIQHPPTWTAVSAERELLRLLGGGCQLPLGVCSTLDPARDELRLRAVFFNGPEGAPPLFADVNGSASDPLKVAELCARGLQR